MIEWLLQVGGFGSDGWDTDSRFGRGPTPYTHDYSISFLWVPFIAFTIMAVCWYILSAMNKGKKNSLSEHWPDDEDSPTK